MKISPLITDPGSNFFLFEHLHFGQFFCMPPPPPLWLWTSVIFLVTPPPPPRRSAEYLNAPLRTMTDFSMKTMAIIQQCRGGSLQLMGGQMSNRTSVLTRTNNTLTSVLPGIWPGLMLEHLRPHLNYIICCKGSLKVFEYLSSPTSQLQVGPKSGLIFGTNEPLTHWKQRKIK